MLSTLVHSLDTTYLGKKNGEAYSHASLPYLFEGNSATSSLHQSQLQLKPIAQSEGQWQRFICNTGDLIHRETLKCSHSPSIDTNKIPPCPN